MTVAIPWQDDRVSKVRRHMHARPGDTTKAYIENTMTVAGMRSNNRSVGSRPLTNLTLSFVSQRRNMHIEQDMHAYSRATHNAKFTTMTTDGVPFTAHRWYWLAFGVAACGSDDGLLCYR